jgi:actin-related protein
VSANPNRKESVFKGAVLFTKTLEANPQLWISKKEYNEQGAQRIVALKSCKSLQV